MQSSQFKISGLLQPTLFGSKTRQPLETYSRSEQTKPFGDHQDLPLTRGVGYLIRFQVIYFHIPIQEQSRKRLRFYTQGRAYQFKALSFGLSKGGKTDGHTQGFKNPPRQYRDGLDDWLVRARSHQACLQHTQELVNNVSATGLAGELREIRAGAQTRL